MLFAILALTFMAFSTTFQFQFVYDDEAQLVGNPLVQSWEYVPYYFSTHVWGHAVANTLGNYYRPVFLLWMRLNHAAFGLNPMWWHVTTVLMHVLATFVVFKLARRITCRDDLALAAAVIFGVHPIHIEAVAWIAGVTESILAVLLLGSFYFYLDWRQHKPNARSYSLALFAIASFSKETAVLMAPLVFCYEWIFGDHVGRLWERFWKSVKPALPYAAITVVYLSIRAIVLQGMLHPVYKVDRKTDLLTIPSVLWFYVKSLVLPVRLSGFYDTPYVTAPTFREFFLPLLLIVVLAAALFLWWWKTCDRTVAFASVLLVLPLLPLMNFSVFQQGEIAHDRYLYLPSIGFCLLIAVALSKLKSEKQVILTAVGIAIVCLPLTLTQSLYWANDMVFYYRGVQVAPNNPLTKINLANEMEKRGMYPVAMNLYEQVLQKHPDSWLANYNLGYLYYKTGDCEKGARVLTRAAMLNTIDPETFYHLGQCEYLIGNLDRAEIALRRAMVNDPRMLGIRYYLGLTLKKQGRNREALDYFRAELSKNPKDDNARTEVTELSGK